MKGEDYFKTLFDVNVNEYKEEKNGLSYLSWPYAWAEVKKLFPEATYEVVKFENGLPYTFDPNTGYMVFTRVEIAGLAHEMWLPVMDAKNHAMKAEPYEIKRGNYTDKVQAATMFDINKTIMRCLVKNLAMFGLGLYIYAGEDLPESDKKDTAPEIKQEPKAPYPPRDEMLELVKKKYPEGTTNHEALLASFGVKSLDKASDAQLMVIWNKYAEK